MGFFRLIIGLGNPGREYVETRHNVGFMIIDRLARQTGAQFRREKSWRAEVAKAEAYLLCKPLTYMNGSGKSVQPISQFYKIAPAQMLIVLDDLALPLGKLRLRAAGSSGGHKGLQSIIEQLGTASVPRLRVGIGETLDGGGTEAHVLGRFRAEEKEVVEQSLNRAVEAIAHVQEHGFEATMNVFN